MDGRDKPGHDGWKSARIPHLHPLPHALRLLHAGPQGDRVDAINKSLTDAERIDRLRLIRSDNVGPRGIMAQTPVAFAP